MKAEIWNHIIKRLTAQETKVSKSELDQWLAENPEHIIKYEEVGLLWELTGKLKPQETREIPDLKADLKLDKPRPKLSPFLGYGIAAACVAALFVFGLHFIRNTSADHVSVWITQTAAPGKMLSVKLPDSSTVMLNAGSTIQYTTNFAKNKTRLIRLKGEAFFEVKHRNQQPFIVESGKIKTVVYGTSFNVRAYQTEAQIEVSVKSGKVGVLKNETAHSLEPIFLLASNSLTFDTASKVFSKVFMQKNDADNWRNGSLVFDQMPILEVLATLSRRFDVKFDTRNYNHASCKLTAKFDNKDLPSILRTIQTVMNIRINQIDQTIYLKGGDACK